MNNSVKLFVAVIGVLGICASIAVFEMNPTVTTDSLKIAACFAALSILIHALQFKLDTGSVNASIAFIPFLSVILLVPSWVSLISVASGMAIFEIGVRRTFIKGFFNVTQYLLAAASAILVYVSLGGKSLFVSTDLYVIPYFLLWLTFFAINTFAVSCVIALSQGLKVVEVWKRNTLDDVAYDFLALPFIYAFAWIYVKYGAVAVIITSVFLLAMRQLYKTNWILKHTNQELLELMVAAIEARDPYTSGHSRRVSKNAVIIAQILGLRTKEVERVGIAGLLHDVGKIHEIFGPILSKPGKLTEEEHAVMQTHAAKSAELVSKVSALSDIVEPILHHHENWDGTGYPAKISGEDIPLISRIIMFADTIDAMTTDRPYRAALSPAAVRAELIKWRGKQFDPTICDMLLASSSFETLFESTAVHQQRPSIQSLPVTARITPGLSST